MTHRALVLFVLVFALLLFGAATLNAAPLAMALPLIAYLAFGLARTPTTPRVTLTRTFSHPRARADEAVTVRLEIRNESAHALDLTFADALPDGMAIAAGDARALLALAPGESSTVEYDVRAPRGEYRFRAARIAIADPFGLVVRAYDVDAPSTLVFEPDPPRLRPVRIRPPRTRGFAGPIAARQAGSGVDFFFLREYQPGDRQRAINWRASARAQARAQARSDQTVFTNLYEQERIADVGLILDARANTNLNTPHGALFEHSVLAAAALADAFLNDGNRVSLLIYGGGLASVFPGYGRAHRMRIMNALGRAEPGQHFVFENLRSLPTRMFTPQSQIVFIGPLPGDDVDTLTRIRARGYAVMVVSPDPVRLAAPEAPSDRIESLARRTALAERALHVQQLRRGGVDVVDWDPAQPLDGALRTALRPTAMQARGSIGGLA
jgi:uncharacterized protein (DUF58 family)